MNTRDERPGPLAADKVGDTAEPGHPQPKDTEVESARLLANETRDRLEAVGLEVDEIRRLADEYIALDKGEDADDFVEWAKTRGGRQRGTG
jgi:hypothetical protein